MSEPIDVPIAFIVFNRPDLTAQVFERIRAARPKELFIIADGPRSPEEREVCDQTRAIASAIDWDCKVRTNFSETNEGCGMRVVSGLTWVFEQCDQAIILEDDCVPDLTFFPYCAELLDKYRDDERVAMISGDNFVQGYSNPGERSGSYYFSQRVFIWGWATWKRAWKNYDFKIKDWPSMRDSDWLRKTYGNNLQTKLWQRNFQLAYSGEIDAWDFQWQYCVLRHNALAILPSVNLISNIGFGESATHTKVVNSQAFLETSPINFPLIHPEQVVRDLSREKYAFQKVSLPILKQQSLFNRIKRRIGRLFSIKPNK